MASSNDQPQNDTTAPYQEALRELLQFCSGVNQSAVELAASRLTVR